MKTFAIALLLLTTTYALAEPPQSVLTMTQPTAQPTQAKAPAPPINGCVCGCTGPQDCTCGQDCPCLNSSSKYHYYKPPTATTPGVRISTEPVQLRDASASNVVVKCLGTNSAGRPIYEVPTGTDVLKIPPSPEAPYGWQRSADQSSQPVQASKPTGWVPQSYSSAYVPTSYAPTYAPTQSGGVPCWTPSYSSAYFGGVTPMMGGGCGGACRGGS
jgi:hypothetical protein